MQQGHLALGIAQRLEHFGGILGVAHLGLRDFDNHVAGAHITFCCRTFGLHIHHHHAAHIVLDVKPLAQFGIQRRDLHAEIGQIGFATAGPGLGIGALGRRRLSRGHGLFQFAERGAQGDFFALAQHIHRHRLANIGFGHGAGERIGRRDRLAVKRHDHVAALNAGFLGRATRHHLGHQGATRLVEPQFFHHLVGDRLDLHAEPAALGAAEFDQLLHHRPRHRRRHRKADADRAAGLREDRGVDANHLAGLVEQRAA